MDHYYAIGLMSGTSLDGLDMVYTRIYRVQHSWEFEILNTKSVSYDTELENSLKNAVNLSAEALLILNNQYGIWLGKQVAEFIKAQNLSPDLIASHGHTVFHQPEKGLTYQLGSGQCIANECNIKVVCDFRNNDLTLNGQGAPFVPIGDRHFFGDYEFCLNLGGISNFSFEKDNQRFAYDIAPANMLLNYLANKQNKPFDENGAIASMGMLNAELLKKLNSLPFYQAPYPKSLGYEWFSSKVIPVIEATEDSVQNLLYTSVQHITDQIAANIKMVARRSENKMLVTGGGAKNTFFINELSKKLDQHTNVVIPDNRTIDFKEALIFAFMGVLRLEKEINVLASVTGATRDSCSGVVYEPI